MALLLQSDAGPSRTRRADRELVQEPSQHGSPDGIPVLGYNFQPLGVWRTSRYALGRGGAYVTSFDMGLVAKNAPLMTELPYLSTDTSLLPDSTYRPISDEEM